MLEDIKKNACNEIDYTADKIIKISQQIYDHPEIKFQEYKAIDWICNFFKGENFLVEKHIGGIETAFKISHNNKSSGKSIAFIAEYDALPSLGHACGHNLITGAAIGALIAFRNIKSKIPGKVMLLGTPGEEGGGGKIKMLERNLFEDCNAALMFHPASYTNLTPKTLALAEITVSSYGKSSHAAAAPNLGINALDGILQTFNAVNMIRAGLRLDARIHGIITKGGESHNVIPGFAQAIFTVRAKDYEYCNSLIEKLRLCAEGASIATGAKMVLEIIGKRKELITNKHLSSIFAKNLSKLNEKISKGMGGPFSTDMGDLSHVIPSIHPMLSICDAKVPLHTKEFASLACSKKAYEVMIKASKALAMTAIDIFLAKEN